MVTVDTNPVRQTNTTNTPAADHWTLFMFYVPLNGSTEYALPIVFLPTGELDLSRTNARDLQLANNILSPTVAFLNTLQPNLDIWKLLNWLFVSNYWTILADLGQVAPTTYHLSDVSQSGSVGSVNLSGTAPTVYPPTNNIFVNESLFEIYQSYLRNEILLSLAPSLFVPPFAPLNSTNLLEPQDVEFVQRYSCSRRQGKSFLDAVVSVLVAQYSLFFGAFGFVLLLAAWFHRRRPHGLFTVPWNGTD
jgi:hypothetical protein